MTNLIGFTGQMGSGKSTAIEVFDERYAYRLVKFAGPLYDMQERIYERIANVYKRPKDFVKDRKLLQWLGTDWGRDTISKTIWVDLWKNEAAYILKNYPHLTVVCDDVRFDNEAATLRAMGGTLIHINTNKNLERITTNTGMKSHSSEAGVHFNPVSDIMVDNNGTLEQYKSSLTKVFNKLKEGK